jgi:hypothetical protein
MPVGKQVALFGIRFDCLTMSEAIASIEESIDAKRALRIGVVNAAKAVNMQQDPELFRDVTSSDLTLADGSSIVWASRLLGRALPERVAGIDLMWEMLELSNRKRYRVFCLGATEEVSAGVAAAIAEKYPRAQLAGRQGNPRFAGGHSVRRHNFPQERALHVEVGGQFGGHSDTRRWGFVRHRRGQDQARPAGVAAARSRMVIPCGAGTGTSVEALPDHQHAVLRLVIEEFIARSVRLSWAERQ